MGNQLGCTDDRKEEETAQAPPKGAEKNGSKKDKKDKKDDKKKTDKSKSKNGNKVEDKPKQQLNAVLGMLTQPLVAAAPPKAAEEKKKAAAEVAAEEPKKNEGDVVIDAEGFAASEEGINVFGADVDDDTHSHMDDEFVNLGASGGSGEAAFRHSLNMAVRTAMGCLVMSLPMIVPSLYSKMDPAYASIFVMGAVEMIVFTACKNVGATTQLAWQGVLGTFCPCVISHIMNALMPGGAKGDYYFAPFVHLVNIAAIFFGLWLNVAKNVRMFALSWHAYFIMEFMNPNSTSVFNTGWAIDKDAYNTTTLVTSTIGALVAVVTTLFPHPVTAGSGCRQAAVESVMRVTVLVSDIAQYYGRDEPSVVVTQLAERASDLRDMIKGMSSDIQSYWWECFDIGTAGRSRELLARHVDMMAEVADIVHAMEVTVAKEDFQESHKKCMEQITPAVSGVEAAAAQLLRAATSAANDGDVSGQEAERLGELVQRAKKANAELAESFNTVRRELSPNKPMVEVLLSEAFFVYSLSAYNSLTIGYTEKLLAAPPKPVPFKEAFQQCCRDVIDPSVLEKAKDIHSFVIRNTISLVSCYYLGFWCLNYSAVAGGTAALLLTDFTGSALNKNMMRLQAVCVGAVLPNIIVKMLGHSCNYFRIGFQGIAIFFWEVLANYVYYSSPYWGYVGCLTGAFSLAVLVYPCMENDSLAEEATLNATFSSASFQKMTETAIAALLMTLVDMILMSGRASTLATDRIIETFMMLDAGTQAAVLPRDETGKVSGGKYKVRPVIKRLSADTGVRQQMKTTGHDAQGMILSRLSLAAQLGEEADKEPRYYRALWPVDFFRGLVGEAHILRANLTVLERALKGPDGQYTDVFAEVRNLPEFGALCDDLLKTSKDWICAVQKVLMNEKQVEMPKLIEKLASLEKEVETLDTLPQLLDAINASGLKYPESMGESLEDDTICRLSAVFLLLETSVFHMAEMLKACIKQAT